MDGAASQRTCAVADKEGAQRAHVLDVDQLVEWCAHLGFLHQVVEILDAGGGAGGERAGRDGVHPDALGPQLGGHVAGGGLECGLDRPHHAVVGNHFVGAVVAHGEQAATLVHQRFGEFGHAHEGVAGDVHRALEAFTRAVGDAAVQVVLGGEGDGVDKKVQSAPALADLFEYGFEFAGLFHVQWQDQRGAELFCQGADIAFRLGIHVSNGQIGTALMKGACTTVGDALIVGDPDNQAQFPAQAEHTVLSHF